ncbi:unnamed protein product, partial [Ectocarpus sp. 6 AP-2014]
MSRAIVFDFSVLRFLCHMSESLDGEVIGSTCAPSVFSFATARNIEKCGRVSGGRIYTCMCKLGLVAS